MYAHFYGVRLKGAEKSRLMTMVTLNVNGEDRRFEEALTVAELIRRLALKTSSIAVEVNRTIVPRSTHEAHRLKDGDRVEIVTFVGGG